MTDMSENTTPEPFTFWSALEGSHPNASVVLRQPGDTRKFGSITSNAGSILRDWKRAQSEIERLRGENARLSDLATRLADKLAEKIGE